jgi:hypothetical protein
MQFPEVLIIFDKGYVAGLGFTEGTSGGYWNLPIAHQFPVNQFRELLNRDTHPRTSFLP